MHAPSSAALSARLVWARIARPTTVPDTAVQWPWCCLETYAWVFGRAGVRAVTTSYTTVLDSTPGEFHTFRTSSAAHWASRETLEGSEAFRAPATPVASRFGGTWARA
jgi:hypothetical protein